MARRYEAEEGGFGFGGASSRQTAGGGGLDIARELQDISSMNRRFSNLISKIGTPSDSSATRKQIRELQSMFTGSVKQTKNAITPQIKGSDPSAKVQGNRYLQSLQKEVSQFEDSLKELRSKEQRHPASDFADSKPSGGGGFSFAMDDGDDFSGGRAAAARREELSRQAQLEETNHQQRQDEHQAMVNLEGDMRDLHSMFVDMAALVNDQGEVINTIEDNVQNAEIKVEAAADQTRQARALKGRRCLVM